MSQDTTNASALNPEAVKVTTGPELNTQTTVTATNPVPPVAPVTPVNPVATAPVQKKGGAGKCILIGCIVVLLCCVITIGGGFALVKFGGAAIVSSQTKPDASLTRFQNANEMTNAVVALDNDTSYMTDMSDGSVKMQFSEKEFLAFLFKGSNITDNPNAFAVDFEKDNMKLEVNLGSVLKATEPNSEYKGLEELYASIDLSANSSGKAVSVNKVSVGNQALDSLFGEVLRQSFDQSFNEMLTGSVSEGTSIKSIVIDKDVITITLESTLPVSPTPFDYTGD